MSGPPLRQRTQLPAADGDAGGSDGGHWWVCVHATTSRPSSSPFRAAPEPVYEVFVVDSRVIHDRHGIGRVLSVRGDRMDVRFGAGIVDVDIRSSKVHLL